MKELEEKYIKLHGEIFSYFTGHSLTPHIGRINETIKKYDCKTLLDYGCGNAKEYVLNKVHEKVWNVDAEWYDPNHKEFNVLPNKTYDIVVSTDVMEHIPEPCVSDVLERIFSKATKVVYMNICTRKAMKVLPNGENAHATVRPPEWWDMKISDANTKNIETVIVYEN